MKQLLNNKKNGVNLDKDLRHEHAVPKKVIKNQILALKTKTYNELFKILDKLGHAVIISKVEDETLNLNHRSSIPNIEDIFSRYKEQQEIKVCQLPVDFNFDDFEEKDLDEICQQNSLY